MRGRNTTLVFCLCLTQNPANKSLKNSPKAALTKAWKSELFQRKLRLIPQSDAETIMLLKLTASPSSRVKTQHSSSDVKACSVSDFLPLYVCVCMSDSSFSRTSSHTHTRRHTISLETTTRTEYCNSARALTDPAVTSEASYQIKSFTGDGKWCRDMNGAEAVFCQEQFRLSSVWRANCGTD